MSVYHDGFSNWADVQMQFETDYAEPAEVLFARYECQNYEGDADVAWRNPDGTISYVSGSHCSCYGLERQWEPETYSAATALDMIKRAPDSFGAAADAIKAALQASG